MIKEKNLKKYTANLTQKVEWDSQIFTTQLTFLNTFNYLPFNIHEKALENISYFGLFGDCSWDSEHAFGVVFHKERMVDFGDWNTAHSFHEEQSSLSISEKHFLKSLPVQRKQLFESAKNIQIDDLTQHLELFDWLIDQRAIYGYRSTKIDLSDNEKAALITTLESLDLSGRNLNELPESMGLLKSLNYLDVGSNEIQVLPDFISEFKRLESLDVSLNSITHLPDSFFKLSTLDYLDLSMNKFDEFPAVIEKLKRLKNIDLSDNKVESIPEWIDQLQNLEDFRISGNKLRSLPKNIGNIDSLEILNASGNRFSFFQRRKIKSWLNKDLNYDIEND